MTILSVGSKHGPPDRIRRFWPKRFLSPCERYLAEVLALQLEYATGLVLHGGDDDDRELSLAVLSHLAPVTPVHTVDALPRVTGAAVCAAELAERVDPATAQLPCDARPAKSPPPCGAAAGRCTRAGGRALFAFFAAMAENIRETTPEGLNAPAREGIHEGRTTAISDDMLHTVHRCRCDQL